MPGEGDGGGVRLSDLPKRAASWLPKPDRRTADRRKFWRDIGFAGFCVYLLVTQQENLRAEREQRGAEIAAMRASLDKLSEAVSLYAKESSMEAEACREYREAILQAVSRPGMKVRVVP